VGRVLCLATVVGGPSRGQTRVTEVPRTINRSEVLELARRIDVGQKLRVDFQPGDVQVLVGAVERERTVSEAMFEYVESGLCPGSRQRAGLRDGRITACLAERTHDLGSDPGAVDGQEHDDIVRSSVQARDNARDRRTDLGGVVDHVERQLAGLADDEHLVTYLTEDAPCPVDERLTLDLRERLRRAEPTARPADEDDATQRLRRHGSE